MGTKHLDIQDFKTLSVMGAQSYIGNNYFPGWTITNLGADVRSISATESTAANIAAVVATIVRLLSGRGLLP